MFSLSRAREMTQLLKGRPTDVPDGKTYSVVVSVTFVTPE